MSQRYGVVAKRQPPQGLPFCAKVYTVSKNNTVPKANTVLKQKMEVTLHTYIICRKRKKVKLFEW